MPPVEGIGSGHWPRQGGRQLPALPLRGIAVPALMGRGHRPTLAVQAPPVNRAAVGDWVGHRPRLRHCRRTPLVGERAAGRASSCRFTFPGWACDVPEDCKARRKTYNAPYAQTSVPCVGIRCPLAVRGPVPGTRCAVGFRHWQ